MTATPVYEFPLDWYQFASATFRIQSSSLVSNRPFLRGKNVKGPYAALWVAEFSLTPQQDPQRQEIAAFFSRLDGQAGLLRIGDPSRLQPWHDRGLTASLEAWSDSSTWSDGTLWASGYLPPDVYVQAAAAKGDNFIVLGGLPASLSNCFRRGDLLQLKPNGIPGSSPSLHEIQVGGATNSSGQIGVEIRPRLRQNFVLGDQATLRNATSVFRLVDDDQGVMSITPPVLGSGGFKLVEALDQVP